MKWALKQFGTASRIKGQSAPNSIRKSPPALAVALRRWGVPATRFLLVAKVRPQRMQLFTRGPFSSSHRPGYVFLREYRISTATRGTGQVENSLCTPLGLHRIARKIGGGLPLGTVFRGRRPVGFIWQGQPAATIAHRILWIEGLEPGFNRGGLLDSFRRFIYLHGVGDETTLGRPCSQGCIHLSATDLIPLYDQLPQGTLVWIQN